jgi:hypothetical protein
MPRISLRAYEKQIEDLIEQNRLQEAIDHCRNILVSYPKCISTYRILGKAFLEGKQYSEAADIFKRVLAVFPDDFIAHVGMSIIRESENNLDAAIWHMELAFDSQPSNITIQEELKRLFGRRDGTHPAKIRLTRGALVRMYARGELYPQAVAEIKSALIEDPKRLDLKVMLAKMYFMLGDSVESLNICNELITELPYCFDVNKTLVAILPTTNRSEKTPVYQDRIKALNPYEAFVNEVYLTEADVPDDQVTLDQLDEIQASTTNSNPSWVQSIQSKWEEPSNLEAIDWLPQTTDNSQPTPPDINGAAAFPLDATSVPQQPSSEESVQAEMPASEPKEEPLPDWMRSAGWLPTEETSNTEIKPEEPINTAPASAEAAGDLPDWLRSLAPNDTEMQAAAPETPSESADLTPTSSAFTETSEPAKIPDNDSDNDLPDWLKNFEVEGTGETKEEVPDWMKDLQGLDQNAAPAVSAQTTAPDSPFAMDETTAGSDTQAENFVSQEKPAHTTRTLDPETVGISASEELNQPSNPILPENWKDQPADEAPVEAKPTNDSGLPDWVRAVMDKMPTPPEETADTDQPAIEPEQEANMNPIEPSDLTKPADENSDADSPALNEKTGDDLLSWLRDLKPSEDQTAHDENEHTGTTGDLPVFDDTSSLDRLQQLSGEPESAPSPVQPAEAANAFEPEPEQAVEPEATEQNAPVSETFESQSPSSLLEHLTQIAHQEAPASENTPAPENENAAYFSGPADSLAEQLKQFSQQIAAGTGIDTVIKNLTELSGQNAENYLVWQLLGDAYAKIDAFTDALKAYNKAEELILKP